MKLSLQQSEIEAALQQYVTNQGITTQGKEVTFDFTMGRKNSGLVVDVNVNSPNVKTLGEALANQLTYKALNPIVQTETKEVSTEAETSYSTTATTTGSVFASNG